MNQQYDPQKKAGKIIGVVFSVFSLCFGGIGLTVIIFLWVEPFDSFGSTPLEFRIFGTFLGLMLVCFPVALLISVFSKNSSPPSSTDLSSAIKTEEGFSCPTCGAGLSTDTEISPSGDVKCPYCNNWFNVRR